MTRSQYYPYIRGQNGDFETSLKVKNKDYILMYDGLGDKIENISTNEVIYPIIHNFAL